MTAAGHARSAVYGWDGQRTARCSCGVEYAGPTVDAVVSAHEAHLSAIAGHTGPAKARAALADSIRKGKPA